MKTDRPTFKELRDKALKNAEVKARYDELSPAHSRSRTVLALRSRKRQGPDKGGSS